MLSSIFNILKAIGDFFVGIATFIMDMVSDLAYVLKLLVALSTKGFVQFFTWLPASVVAMLSVFFAVAIVFRVIGRE